MAKKWDKLRPGNLSTNDLLNAVPGLRKSLLAQASGAVRLYNRMGPRGIIRNLAIAAVKGYLLGLRGVEMRKLDAKERLLVERLNQVLEDNHPTTEELAITLEITPEDILERFPDRVYDLREKIVDATMIFGDMNEEDPEGWYEDDAEGGEEEET